MSRIEEHDAMICRSCGNEERASEGYPCSDCGTFICIMCDLRGIVRCRSCQAKRDAAKASGSAPASPASPASPTSSARATSVS